MDIVENKIDHQRTVLLPKAMYDWRNIRIQDFKSVDEYNSALFKIVSKLKLCGEDITDKDMVVENGMDVVVEAETRLVEAEATHMAVAKETLMEAVVMAEVVVHHLNHKT